MEFQVKKTAKVTQIRVEVTIPIIKQTFRNTFQVYRAPDSWTTGISSRCMDGQHVLFFDFDDVPLNELVDEIKYLQDYYCLSAAYVFEIEKDKSYHVIILDKFNLRKAHKILSSAGSVEWAYQNSALWTRSKEWVLRVIEKGARPIPKFLQLIESKHDIHEISTAHKNFLQKYAEYNRENAVPKKKYKVEDNIIVLPKIKYNTGNRVD